MPPSPQVKEKEAVEGQFGGTDVQGLPGHTPQWKMPKISNAYMLVYVRESAIPEINVDASGEDIAEHLRRTLEKEHEEKARIEFCCPRALPLVSALTTHHVRTTYCAPLTNDDFLLITYE